jgi:hypothetical protein
MMAYPKPDDLGIVHDSDDTVGPRYSGREDRLGGMDSLEVQTGIVCILLKETERFSCLFLDISRQFIITPPEPIRGC